ncbi:uncharacterized protein LOC126742390 isoform X1 [Anthonomus grandis grandis]|uniref:uncharacterized protein LOC126742390 isoform X1 n=1 Tax=Anthonomus grandis grandis TaxID=2921223 RepID=UPI0021665923|nr:uncharacterized protein LOC126742390 isoform X1 [Anthonomus grandis grandis]
MECPPPKMDRVHIDITTYPTAPPPPPPVEQPIPPKLLAIMAKYPQNWRLEQLSKPRRLVKKYVPLPTDYVKPMKKRPSLNDEIKFYSDQNSRPRVRDLYINRALYSKFTKGLRKKFNKNITKAWGSIYNYYKNKERLRKLRELRRKQKDKKGKKRVLDPAKYEALAKPKPVFYPEPKKKTSKIFDNYGHLDELAAPKPSYSEPPKSLEINPHALTYVPTENVLKLAKIPARFLNVQPPLEPGKVTRAALRYKITPKIEALAQPKQRSEKSKEDEDLDPWAISKNALKYKATPRILELAKPTERE